MIRFLGYTKQSLCLALLSGLVAILVWPMLVSAATPPSPPAFTLTNQTTDIVLAGNTRYFRETSAPLNLQQFLSVLQKQDLPTTPKAGHVLGITEHHYWFYTTFTNVSDIPEWYLHFHYFGNGSAEVYLADERGDWQQIGGVTQSLQRHFLQPLRLNPINLVEGVPYQLAIRALSPGPDKFDFHISNADSLQSFTMWDNRWLGIFYGGFITLILYNFFVALSMRSATYGYYVGYLLSMAIFLLVLDGFGHLYIWSEYENWSKSAYYVFVGGLVIFGSQFSRLFLNTKTELPTLDRILRVIIYCAALLSLVIALFSSHPLFTSLSMVLASVYAFSIFAGGCISYIRGNRMARYFLLAWIFPSLGILYTTSMYSGLVPFNSLGYNALHFTSLIEAILLSMALADRINILREERQTAVLAAKSRLEESNRELALTNELKDAFLGTISHELRTPMNGVIAALELLKQSTLDDKDRSLLNTMSLSSETMLTMIERILCFSELQSKTTQLHLETVNLEVWLKQLDSHWKQQCDVKKIHWQLKSSIPSPTWLSIDMRKVDMLLSELISNAIKFTPNGTITLEISFTNIADVSALSITLSDTGIGIPTERRHELFKPFHQLQYKFDRQYGGLGIGLALSQELANVLGGSLALLDQDKNVQGTTIRCIFPIRQVDVAEQKPAELSVLASANAKSRTVKVNNPDHQALNILIVEDNPVNQMIMKTIMASLGHRYELAEDGERAVVAAKQQHFDLILMDCQMPVMDGFEATRQIRKSVALNAKTPIIAVTANAMEGDRQRCLDAGMDDYIKKPVKPRVIDEALQHWVA